MVRALWCIPIALLTAALTAMPTEPPNLALALEAQQRLVAEQPSNAKAHNDLGNLLVATKRFEEAETAYEAALALAPADPAIHFNLAVLYQQTGRRKKAQEQYRELLEIDGRNAWAHYQLGVLLEGRGQRGQAIEHYARAFAYDEGLTFASNNPHLIENRLVTEALLQARRYREQPGAQVPRQYGDPTRIRNLLLELPTPAAEPVAEAPAEIEVELKSDPGAIEGSTEALIDAEIDALDTSAALRSGGRALTHEDLSDSGVGQARDTGGGRRGGGSPGYRPAAPAPATPQYRRPVTPPSPSANRSGLGAQPLSNGRQLGGTTVGGVAAGGANGGSTAGRTPRPGAVVRSPGTTPGTPFISPQAGGGSGGRPSRRSTSQLDLQLLPERMPGERYAELAPQPRG